MERPTRLLSLDGGGVRGLSSIMILKHIMGRINDGRPDNDKLDPWQVFDMMGGTSTGGIIAIMLGRLRMTLEACEEAYVKLSRDIFTGASPGILSWAAWIIGENKFLQPNGRFDAKALENAIKKTIQEQNFPEEMLLKDDDPKCKVFVVAVRENNSEAAIMRSYKHPKAAESLFNECKAWQACRATSAATTFFDPIAIGRKGQRFIDGGLLYNNPVGLLHQEASALWPDRDSLIISIGTGEPPGMAFKGSALKIVQGLKNIATETEKTADNFFLDHKNMVEDSRYYRFNVTQGLASIGLEEWKQIPAIADTTETYMDRGEVRKKIEECVERLLQIESDVSLNVLQRRHFERAEQEEHDKIVDWLAPIDSMQKQKDVSETRYGGTGLWLLGTPEFQEWFDNGKVLWCFGMPGAGKTTLVSMLVDHLREKFGARSDVGVASCYCEYGLVRTKKQTPENLLASLWKDLAIDTSDLSEVVNGVYQLNRGKSRPSITEVSRALHAEIRRYSTVFLIIDALDECTEEDRFRERFVNELVALPVNAKLIITSRENVDIEEQFDGVARCEIRAAEQDVRAYLISQLPRFKKAILQGLEWENLQEEIIETIISCADGMFLLAKLHLDALLPKQNRRDLKAALQNLPKGTDALKKTYDNAMERIDAQEPENRALSTQVLSWVLLAQRPLTIDEMRFALAVYPKDEELDPDALRDEGTLVGCCSGLVKIDRASTVIDFAHSTVRDYFRGIQDQLFPDAQRNIAATCLTYLLFKAFSCGASADDDSMNERLLENVFLQYAARYWGNHAYGDHESSIREPILTFFGTPPNMTCAVQAMHISHYRSPNYSQSYPREVQGLWLAAYFGLTEIVQWLVSGQTDCTAVTSYGENAVHIASRNGHKAVVELLLAEDTVNIDTTDTNGDTELHVAAAGGHTDVVRLLLKYGANINTQTQLGCSALYLAAANGHSEVVSLLLQQGANFQAADMDGTTPLDMASWRGHEDVVQQLLLTTLERGIGQHSPRLCWALGTHLCKCVIRGKKDDRSAVELLLNNGADADHVMDDDGMTALCRAVEKGDIQMAEMLLSYGSDLNGGNSTQPIPLHVAVTSGQTKMVKFLLNHGANVSIRDFHSGRTALTVAYNVHGKAEVIEEIKQILIANGANPADAYVETNEQTLLDRDIYSPSDWPKDDECRRQEGALSEDSGIETVRKTFELDGSINRRSNTGWTALHKAANEGNIPIVRYLIELKADVNALDDTDGITPLHLSCINNQTSTTDLLIKAGARIEEQMERLDGTSDKSAGTPLHWACISGAAGSVNLLLKAGANIEARNDWYRTPLHLAARNGHVQAAQLLLGHGADLESLRDTDETPLHFAVEENRYEMVQFLLQQGANVEAKGSRGTPLHLAVRKGHDKVAELLRNASTNKQRRLDRR